MKTLTSKKHSKVSKTSSRQSLTTLKVMSGPAMNIRLLENIHIHQLHMNTPRRNAYAHQRAAKEELDRIVRLGVIEKVQGGSKWISPMSFIAKQDGGMRLVADLVHLNKHVKWPIHLFMFSKDIINQIKANAKYFAPLDVKSGCWQLQLDEEPQKYTCFITEWGLYRYCRAPMGLVCSGDIFCQRTDAALAVIPGRTKRELLERIELVLERCEKNKITLSDSKMQLGAASVQSER